MEDDDDIDLQIDENMDTAPLPGQNAKQGEEENLQNDTKEKRRQKDKDKDKEKDKEKEAENKPTQPVIPASNTKPFNTEQPPVPASAPSVGSHDVLVPQE